MSDLHAMMQRWARPGCVDWIGVRPERRAEMAALPAVEITDAGVAGDRARAGKRALTLIQAEHLTTIGSFLGKGPVPPDLMRRNMVISGLNLAALKGRDLAIGSAIVHLTTICAPCSRMEETFGEGGYSAVRGHGGWCAQVVQPGHVAIGDAVRPLD
ncbi:MOSC domain-containing protein [uncultured Tateyamaria sp.]|uniref:MOSC domain-containing protein n=1 Tax=uncultured Tateyamaria sp. TaxID=455651 RepID=UPI0026361532|nr:MOSC domain-containing protein [uncultured Tateyamaria sp.]